MASQEIRPVFLLLILCSFTALAVSQTWPVPIPGPSSSPQQSAPPAIPYPPAPEAVDISWGGSPQMPISPGSQPPFLPVPGPVMYSSPQHVGSPQHYGPEAADDSWHGSPQIPVSPALHPIPFGPAPPFEPIPFGPAPALPKPAPSASNSWHGSPQIPISPALHPIPFGPAPALPTPAPPADTISPELPPLYPAPGPVHYVYPRNPGAPATPSSPMSAAAPGPEAVDDSRQDTPQPISPEMPPFYPVPSPAADPAEPATPTSPAIPASPAVYPIYYAPLASSPMPTFPIPNLPETPSPALSPISVSFPPESVSPMPSPIAQSPDWYPMPSSPTPAPLPVLPSRVKAAYWPSFDGFPVSAIDTSYFTHVYYAFLLPDPVTYQLAITPNDAQMLPSFIAILNNQTTKVKTMLSIGGAGNDPQVFSKIASTTTNRAIFITSTIEIARKYGFDGVDLDWEFPLDQEDMDNLGALYKEWRYALQIEAWATRRPCLLLTSAVYYASTVRLNGVTRSYPGESIRKYVDWISPMCFDYHGSWDNVTGQASALYDPSSIYSTVYGLQSWIIAGVPRRKLVMGMPVYGHTWTLADPNVHGIGAPAIGVGPGGTTGVLTYSEIISFNSNNNASVEYDAVTASMYSYVGNIWIGYDDPTSVKDKVKFARGHGLRGYFFWALGQDLGWSISREASSAWEH